MRFNRFGPRKRLKVEGDAEKLVAWLREGADELEKAHAILDSYGVPRGLPWGEPGVPCTLAARIAVALGETGS